MDTINVKESEDLLIVCSFEGGVIVEPYVITSHLTKRGGIREVFSVRDTISVNDKFELFIPRYTLEKGSYTGDIIFSNPTNNNIIVTENFLVLVSPAVTDLRKP